MSFQQGLSGLNASSKNLEVIGNNVANANTIGAKGSRAEFGDMYGTANISIEMNLDSRKAVTLPATAPQIDFTDAKTYSDATSVTVFDAKGQDVALTYYFQKSATDTWNVYATANGTSVNVDGAGNPLPVTTINFPANGGTPTSPAGAVAMDIP